MTQSTDHLVALARPVRHEANNLLAAISGTADLMLRAAATDKEKARAERVKEASQRLEALLRGYLALAAPPAEGTAPRRVLEMLRPVLALLLGPGRVVEVAVAEGLPMLAATPAELQAAAMDLARHAAAQAPKGGGLRVALDAAPGGATLYATPTPHGPLPEPRFFPAA
jgi:signal transduction histidine kinase